MIGEDEEVEAMRSTEPSEPREKVVTGGLRLPSGSLLLSHSIVDRGEWTDERIRGYLRERAVLAGYVGDLDELTVEIDRSPAKARSHEPPWDELDSDVREVVREMWEAGFRTTASCGGHGKGDASVTIDPDVGAWEDVDAVLDQARRLEGWLEDRMWDEAVVVSIRWVASRFRPWIVVEWWGAVPTR